MTLLHRGTVSSNLVNMTSTPDETPDPITEMLRERAGDDYRTEDDKPFPTEAQRWALFHRSALEPPSIEVWDADTFHVQVAPHGLLGVYRHDGAKQLRAYRVEREQHIGEGYEVHYDYGQGFPQRVKDVITPPPF